MSQLFREFSAFLRYRKRYWLVPMLIIMILFGGLIALLLHVSGIASFSYPLF